MGDDRKCSYNHFNRRGLHVLHREHDCIQIHWFRLIAFNLHAAEIKTHQGTLGLGVY